MGTPAIRLAHKPGQPAESQANVLPGSIVSGTAARAPLGPIGGLMFDVADVFYDATLWRRWLWRLVGRLGVRAGYADFFVAWDRLYLPDVCCGRREYSEALQAFLLAAGLTWAQVDEIEASGGIQRRNLELNVRPLPGIVKTVSQLAEIGLRLAAWSDAAYPAAKLDERLERLGLGRRFDVVISSFDLEAAQPARCCYTAVVEALNLAAGQVVYVGHDTEHLAGAKAAGLPTVAFNHQRHAQADYYLTQFQDLLPLVRSWPSISQSADRPTAAASRLPAMPRRAEGSRR